MYIAQSTMQGAPLHLKIEAERSRLLGFVRDVYIDPGQGKIVMVRTRKHHLWGRGQYWYAEGITSQRGRLYLHCKSDDVVSVDSIDRGVILLRNIAVYTESGTNLGRVDDVYFDQTSFMLVQLEVSRRMLFFPFLKLLISREDIVDILPKRIIVRDAVLEETELLAVFLPKPKLASGGQTARQIQLAKR